MRPWKRAETPTCGTRSRTDHEISSARAPAPTAAAATTRRALLAAALGARTVPPADDEMSWQSSMVCARPMMIAPIPRRLCMRHRSRPRAQPGPVGRGAGGARGWVTVPLRSGALDRRSATAGRSRGSRRAHRRCTPATARGGGGLGPPAGPAAATAVNLGPSALEPATTGGLATLDRALAKLSTHKRLLVIAAHPDDEDTALLTLVSRGMGGEAAYLSLSRGEGGQDLIGPELGVGLGLIRSRERLAARAIDGSRQYFTRAYDFGYTLSLEETLGQWPREVMLEDTVRVIRRFKPQVVVSVFPGVPHRNHGQHQEAAAIASAAFPVAGDAPA